MSAALVTVTLLMGMLIGTRWMKPGETIDMEEDYAKELAAMKPPRVQIGGTVPQAALPADHDKSGSEMESDPDAESDSQSDNSLETFGFAGKTLHLLQAAGISTVTQLRETIDAGTKIEGVGEKTLASIQAQLEAAAE